MNALSYTARSGCTVGLFVALLDADLQQTGKTHRVGYLRNSRAPTQAANLPRTSNPRSELRALASRPSFSWWWIGLLVIALVQGAAGIARADVSDANSAASLRAKYPALRDQLGRNPFHGPLYLESSQNAGDLKGDIYALIDYPLATVNAALKGASKWCDILILHLGVKYCRASEREPAKPITVYAGRKVDQPLDKAYRVEFAYRVAAETADYLRIVLSADSGPFDTSNCQILLEAVPLEGGRTFVHLSYSYTYGTTARLAMQAYLTTLGREKVGFTIIDKRPDGQPVYIGNVRGAIERDTMRYYLAIVAYLGALPVPPQERLERRLRDWFSSTEHYRAQLHEVEEGEYLEMKRKEYRRQQPEG